MGKTFLEHTIILQLSVSQPQGANGCITIAMHES